MSERFDWDIFCRVVDNFGDAGICWRIARQLAIEHGERVRLWIDDVASLHRLAPAVATGSAVQEVDGVEIHRWTQTLPRVEPARIVVEAFGCGLPEDYVSAMAAATPRPLWVVYEYLSAEPWVAEHHGLPSPHPRWPLERYYFFPGFVAGTGGLLRERDLFERRERFQAGGAAERARVWRRLGHDPQPDGTTAVSLFCYESAPLHVLLDVWARGGEPTICAVLEGRMLPPVLAYFGVERAAPGRVLRRGALEVRVVPFSEQALHDELLWTCDINFVRGEDSLVRAQWAVRSFVWHIYPQHDLVHAAKLEAFLALYGAGLAPPARVAAFDFTRAWNGIETPAPSLDAAWAAFTRARGMLHTHGASWAAQLAALGDATANLARFCSDRLK